MYKILYQILYDVDKILTLHNIPFWITSGSLLGAVRVHGILQKDHDVDICVVKKFKSRLLDTYKDLQKCGYTISKTDRGYAIHRKRYLQPYLDIHLVKKNGNKFVSVYKRVRDFYPKDYFVVDDVFPLKRVAFGGFIVFSPKNPIPYLQRMYGRGWKNKDQDGSKSRSKRPAKPYNITRRKCIPPLRPAVPGRSVLNKFCGGVFVFSLHDYRHRLKRIVSQMQRKGIGYTVFDAIDGRCKTPEECKSKRKALELEYNVKIGTKEKLPPLSLTLGTWYLLKQQVKNKWKHMCILEDDAVFVNNFDSRLAEGLRELKEVNPNWDLLYLGCTQFCGIRGITKHRTTRTKHITTLNKYIPDADFYVQNKWDIRFPCRSDECEIVSKNLTIPYEATGGYGYITSLKGARKILRLIGNHMEDHFDGMVSRAAGDGILNTIAFDPPIINHYGGADRPDTSIEWNW
jgi:GR25 family glycosyltransferase involved in LPS biosynthesis